VKDALNGQAEWFMIVSNGFGSFWDDLRLFWTVSGKIRICCGKFQLHFSPNFAMAPGNPNFCQEIHELVGYT
jgi:hypothetical protein